LKAKKFVDAPLVIVNLVFVILLLHLFFPPFSHVSKLFLLDKVPLQRSLIGLGLLGVFQITLFIKNLSAKKPFDLRVASVYSLLIFLVGLSTAANIHFDYPGFVRMREVLVFSLPLPVATYLLLRKKIIPGLVILTAFSIYSSAQINPLYRGLALLENNPLNSAVQSIKEHDPSKRWLSEGLMVENVPLMNGAPSLSGVNYYPQKRIWETIPGKDNLLVYNRYAHIHFQLLTEGDRNDTHLKLLGPDQFIVSTNVCSEFLNQNRVGYLLTTAVLSSPCIKLDKTISFPAQTFYIYARH
jgi:hypothetical protein